MRNARFPTFAIRGAAPALFVLTAGLAAFDLVADLDEGISVSHVALEATIIAAGLAGVALTLRRLRGAERARDALRADTERLRSGLSAAIDEQLLRWQLSPAEREIALLMLKGLSHKAIATVRDVSEATVRQQARAIYKKAGLDGRHDLAAYFLEDLLVFPAGPSASVARIET